MHATPRAGNHPGMNSSSMRALTFASMRQQGDASCSLSMQKVLGVHFSSRLAQGVVVCFCPHTQESLSSEAGENTKLPCCAVLMPRCCSIQGGLFFLPKAFCEVMTAATLNFEVTSASSGCLFWVASACMPPHRLATIQA